MANITKRGDSYRIRVYVGEDSTGKQLFKSLTWTPEPTMTERQVQKELNRQATLFEEAVRSGQNFDDRMTVQDFCELWFRDYAERQLKPKTVQSYRVMSRRVYKYLGRIKIGKLKPNHIIDFLRRLEDPAEREVQGQRSKSGAVTRSQSDQPLSSKTIRNCFTFLSSVLSTAVEWRVIGENPCKGVKPPKQIQHRIEYLDDVQIKQFIASLDSESTERKAIFYLLVFTGMRRGELLGLEWRDIDWSNKTIRIERTSQYTPNLGVYEAPTKTVGSNRVIKTSDTVLDVLRQHQTEQRIQQMKCGDLWQWSGRIFTTWDGAPMHPNTPYTILQKILKKNGLPAVSLHSLRHSNASILISNGTDIKTVSARLGHSNVTTTMNIYAEQIQSADAAAAEQLDDVILLSSRISG